MQAIWPIERWAKIDLSLENRIRKELSRCDENSLGLFPHPPIPILAVSMQQLILCGLRKSKRTSRRLEWKGAIGGKPRRVGAHLKTIARNHPRIPYLSKF